MFTFFPGSRPALKSSGMKKLDSWEPKEQHEASTKNIHDLWFKELLVNKQARWRREKRTKTRSALTVDSPGHLVHLWSQG